MRTAKELSNWQGYLTHNEIDEIQRVTRSMIDRRRKGGLICVNIGAGAGTSTISMLEVDRSVIVFSVDILASGTEVTTNEHLRLAECGDEYLHRVKRIWGDSKIVGLNWPVTVDMVFVDGDHTREGCAADITAWLPHIKTNGYILFHDYGSRNWPGVALAVDEIMGAEAKIGSAEKIGLVDTVMVYRIK